MPRPLTWIIWSVLLPVVPFFAAWVVGLISSGGQPPTFDELIGGGHLLLTVIALFGSVIKDLIVRADAPGPAWLRNLLISLAGLFALFTALVYGQISALGLGTVPNSVPVIATVSLVAYGAAFLVSGVGAFVPGATTGIPAETGATR